MLNVTSAKNLTLEEKRLLKTEIDTDPNNLGYKDVNGNYRAAAEIARLLTQRQLIPNPEPQPQIPKPIDTNALMSLVSPTTIAAADYAALQAIEEAADSNDRPRLMRQFQVWQAKGWLSDPNEIAAIQGELVATIGDPNWKAQIPDKSPIERVIGRNTGISVDEVNEILNLV